VLDFTAKPIPVFDNHERFFKLISVNQATGCWNWLGEIQEEYGRFYFWNPETKKSSYRLSHRVSYDIFTGITDVTKVLDHKCRNKACCNPDHLREVTRMVNTTENSNSVGFINKSKTKCIRGHEFRSKEVGRRHCLECKNLGQKLKRIKFLA